MLAAYSSESSNLVTTYDGSQCSSEGETDFVLNSAATFGFNSASDTTDLGFTIWIVPEGTTTEEILEERISGVVGTSAPYKGKLPPTAIGTSFLDIHFGLPGQHAIVYSDASTDRDHAVVFTVIEG